MRKSLSAPWTGRTVFHIVKKPPAPGHEWAGGWRHTKVEANTPRPTPFVPEEWQRLGDKNRKIETEKWKIEKPLLKAARERAGVDHPKKEEFEEYEKLITDCKAKFSIAPAPQMLTVAYEYISRRQENEEAKQRWYDAEAQLGQATPSSSSTTTIPAGETQAPEGQNIS